MLIIFDLDDTLIQTTRSVTPFLLKKAVLVMVRAGLPLKNVEEAIQKVIASDVFSMSAQETLVNFLLSYPSSEKFLALGLKELYEDFPKDLTVSPMEDAQTILARLKKLHTLALVTAGIEERQQLKMEKAGIEPSLFSKIAVCGSGEKGRCYQEIACILQKGPRETIVCGDRIQSDLLPAKELGLTTIHIRQGRGANEPIGHSAVDYSIEQLFEVHEVVERIYDYK